MDKKTQIYTEVYMTLANLNKNIIDKIPEELKMKILDKADTSYPYNINELLPESQALIAVILKKYIYN